MALELIIPLPNMSVEALGAAHESVQEICTAPLGKILRRSGASHNTQVGSRLTPEDAPSARVLPRQGGPLRGFSVPNWKWQLRSNTQPLGQ